MNMHFKVNHQKVTASQRAIASDSVNYLTADFEFSEDWIGIDKFISFKNGDDVKKVLIKNNVITKEQSINLTKGEWIAHIFGIASEGGKLIERITTVPVRISVQSSGVMDGDPFPEITPSVGEQIISEAIRNADKAEASAESAEESAQMAAKLLSNTCELSFELNDDEHLILVKEVE